MDETDLEIDKILDKKKGKSLYLERQQTILKDSIESGMLNPDQQYRMIENIIDNLLGTNNISEEHAKKFFDDIKRYSHKLEELQIQISEIYKDAYKRILEL